MDERKKAKERKRNEELTFFTRISSCKGKKEILKDRRKENYDDNRNMRKNKIDKITDIEEEL